MDKINFIFLRSKVGNDERFKDEEKNRFLNAFNAQNDFEFTKDGKDIFFIETGGVEEEFKRIFSGYSEPYYLLATNANNSLPASLEIATYLRKNNKKFKLFHGTPEEIRNQIKFDKIETISCDASKFVNKDLLKNKRYGVVGKPSDWLISSDVNYALAKEKLGIDLIDISSEEFLNEIKNTTLKKTPIKFDALVTEKVDEKTVYDAVRIYKALKSLISRYNLNGLTVRCFDLLNTVHNTSCLALAMLNEDGYIATCEGDVPAMITMAIVREKFNESSFQVNPSYVNLEQKYAYFAHCTLPLDMCESYMFDTHFESGIGLGVKGELKLEDVTVFKVNANLTDYEIFEGQIEENLKQNNLCRTQVKVRFDADISEILNNPNGNHLVIFYGHHKDELVKILSF